MTRPTAQNCHWCGNPFIGSDCLGKPCDECRQRYGLKCLGVGRDAENPKALSVSFDRELTDRELREITDYLNMASSIIEPPKPFEVPQ